jgi:hypothetical protein
VGINGVYSKLEKRNTKGSRWNLEAERACFCSLSAFKIYHNIWGEEDQGFPSDNQ